MSRMGNLWKLFLVLVVLSMCFSLVEVALADKPNYNGTEHGNGKPPDHAKAGGKSADKWNNDPDDDGRGPDRGDGTVDAEDWNNGCGNDEDRADDNEGWCGRPKSPEPVINEPPELPPVEPVETPTVIVYEVCKLSLWGETPEVFESGVDVHNPANEALVLAESHEYLELTLPRGFAGTILWYRPGMGHRSIAQGFVCDEEVLVIHEPHVVGHWME